MSLYPLLHESDANLELLLLYEKYSLPDLQTYRATKESGITKPSQRIARSLLDMLAGNGIKARYIIINLDQAKELFEELGDIPLEFEWAKIILVKNNLFNVTLIL